MATIQRLFGITDDAAAGGSSYDTLVAGAIPDATIFWPATGGTLDRNIEKVDRNAEVRARRPVTPPRPFRAAPTMTIPVPAYRSVVEKLVKKALGGADTVTPGSGTTAQNHAFAALGFGSTYLPAVHAQLVRDDLNYKMSGAALNRLHFAFPLDGEGTIEAEFHGLYAANFVTAAPTASFTGLSDDVMMLRDAEAFFDGASEVQTVSATGTTAGTFTLTVPANNNNVPTGTTGAIQWNTTAAALKTALELIVGAGQTTVTGGPLNTTPIVVTFSGNALAGRRIPLMTITPTGITGGTVTNVETTPGGASIPDLQGFEFTWINNVVPKWYAKRNIVTQTIGTPQQIRKLWFPQERKLAAAQDVSYQIMFGNVNSAQELAYEYGQIQKLVFEVVGAPLATTPAAVELLRISIYAGEHTDGGAEALNARDDITATFSGGAFYSDTAANDVLIEVVNATTTPIT